MPEFHEVFGELLAHWGGTKTQLAERLGITPSSLSRLQVPGHQPSVEICMKVADVFGVSATRVLRAAGKGEFADLAEDLFGHAAERHQTKIAEEQCLSVDERNMVIHFWRRLGVDEQRLLRQMGEKLIRAHEEAARTAATKKTK